MMDPNESGSVRPGLFGGMGPGMGMGMGPSPGGPMGGYGGQTGLSGLSPYLNIDTAYLNTQTPEYILNQDVKRGWLENSFTAIGSSVLMGAAAGGTYGLYEGVRTASVANMTGRLRRTHVINHTLKSGSSISNSLASIAVIYSSLHALIGLVREDDDELKSLMTGAATGLLYKSTSGVRKCAMGAAFGGSLAAAWAFFIKKDERIASYI